MAVQAFTTDVADPTPSARGEIIQIGMLIFSMATGTYTLTIPVGCLVRSVTAFVTEAFDGTAPAIIVGDGDNTSGFLTSAIIAPATALTVTAPAIKQSYSATSATAFEFGKYYPTGDTLDIGWTKASAGPTTGKCIIIMSGILLPRCGIPAGLLNGAVL